MRQQDVSEQKIIESYTRIHYFGGDDIHQFFVDHNDFIARIKWTILQHRHNQAQPNPAPDALDQEARAVLVQILWEEFEDKETKMNIPDLAEVEVHERGLLYQSTDDDIKKSFGCIMMQEENRREATIRDLEFFDRVRKIVAVEAESKVRLSTHQLDNVTFATIMDLIVTHYDKKIKEIL